MFEEAGDCPHCGMELLRQTPEEHENMLRMTDMTIGFYLQDGVEVLDFAGPMEVFAYAGFNIVTIGKTKDPIRSQGIVKITPDYSVKDAPPLDVVAFFGGNGVSSSSDPEVQAWLKSLDGVEYYFTVCTGAFFLAHAGLLDGKTATTFHSEIDGLRDLAPKTEVLADARWVDNGNIITTAGVSAGIDGALYFVSKLAGLDAAVRVAVYMEYETWEPTAGVNLDY
jgi:transcriptional regulator GlxA family with amidase domain